MISQTAEYALRAAVFLANSASRPRPAWEIAEATAIPASYLTKVLGALVRAGLVNSQRGLRGGFVLAHEPQAITLLELIRAVENWKRADTCPLDRPQHEHRLCLLHRRLSEAQARIEEILRGCTLRELIAPVLPRGGPAPDGRDCPFPGSSTP